MIASTAVAEIICDKMAMKVPTQLSVEAVVPTNTPYSFVTMRVMVDSPCDLIFEPNKNPKSKKPSIAPK